MAIYDLKVDKRLNKFGKEVNSNCMNLNKLPVYLKENKENYKD